MEKAQVIKLRELYKDSGYVITCDNMKIFTNKPESDDSLEYVLWDDANEMVYSIRINHNHDTQRTQPVNILGTSYDMIQFISASCTIDQFDSIIGKLNSLKCDTETVANIKKKYDVKFKKK